MKDRILAIVALFMLAAQGGCGYTFGVTPGKNVRTIAVPVFENKTLRRGFERDLTAAVQREIKESLPYVIAFESTADLILRGQIMAIEENVLVEGRNDEVLEGNIQITVQIRLFDKTESEIFITRQASDNQGPNGMTITDVAEFVPSRGENRSTATREALRQMAERIVQVLAGPPYIGARSKNSKIN
jgi:hypothetical protein